MAIEIEIEIGSGNVVVSTEVSAEFPITDQIEGAMGTTAKTRATDKDVFIECNPP